VRFRTHTKKKKSEKPIGLEASQKLDNDSVIAPLEDAGRASTRTIDTVQESAVNEGETPKLDVLDNERLEGEQPGEWKDHDMANHDSMTRGPNESFYGASKN
jgi:hypothetical protein